MISVLIPVYNHNIVALVKELHQQLMSSGKTFEIIAMDDFSESQIIIENSEIDSLSHTHLHKSSKNYGRVQTRQRLSDKANYEWLLFLDADVMPESPNFIQNYINLIVKDHDAIYGGFSYLKNAPEADRVLRWEYGRNQEEVDAKIRNTKPYKIVISANFLIKKSVFNSINSKITTHGYGYDNYFGALLKQNRIDVFHINNPVQHLGIEPSAVFLHKTEEAVDTLLKLYQDDKMKDHENGLLSFFITLKKYRLHHVFSYIYKAFDAKMRKNLLDKKPSIPLLQLYRLSYMCYKSNLNRK